MPRNRDYSKEYEDYHSKPEQRRKRSERNKARRAAAKKGLVSKGDGKEVDHKKPMRKGGTNSDGTRVVTTAKNRAWRKGKKGYD